MGAKTTPVGLCLKLTINVFKSKPRTPVQKSSVCVLPAESI